MQIKQVTDVPHCNKFCDTTPQKYSIILILANVQKKYSIILILDNVIKKILKFHCFVEVRGLGFFSLLLLFFAGENGHKVSS